VYKALLVQELLVLLELAAMALPELLVLKGQPVLAQPALKGQPVQKAPQACLAQLVSALRVLLELQAQPALPVSLAQLVQELQAPLASLVKRAPLVRLAPSGLLVPLELLAW
jgi:hypothetical protein